MVITRCIPARNVWPKRIRRQRNQRKGARLKPGTFQEIRQWVVDNMKNTNYKFWAGPGGREVTRRIQKYKRHIVFLYCIIGVLMVAGATLSSYICSLLNGGI